MSNLLEVLLENGNGEENKTINTCMAWMGGGVQDGVKILQ